MRVLISKEIHHIAKERLEDLGHEVIILEKDQKLLEAAKDADALISMLSDRIDKNFLDQNKHLKVITNYAVGHNNIDSAYAKKLNIPVGNTPDVLTNATAEMAMALLFSVARNLHDAKLNVERSEWTGWEPLGFLGKELSHTTVGIIGAGRIGKRFAQICHFGLNMNVLYYSRSKKEELERELSAKQVTLDELYSKSDVISLHCPLTEQTKGLIDSSAFEKMKSDALLINTARGEVIDEKALYNALKNKKIRAAGLDVTAIEPLDNQSPLRELDNCYIIPHIGSATVKARKDMALICVENIQAALNKCPLRGDVNNIYV